MRRLLLREFEVHAAAEPSWFHLAQVEAWPSWARHIKRVRLDPPGPVGPSTRGRLVLSNHLRTSFAMTEFEPGVHWAWTGAFLWLRIRFDHRFEPTVEGTRITFTMEGAGFGVRYLGPLFARIYARNLDTAIPRLVAELDSLAQTFPDIGTDPASPTLPGRR
jgi:hypothetical protein